MKLRATLRPAVTARKLQTGDVSQGSMAQPFAWRDVLGKRVLFYRDGTHRICSDTSLTEEELFNSQLLRFVHASLITAEPQGQKDYLYVDAAKNPVAVYICGLEGQEYLRQVHTAIQIGQVPAEMIADHDTGTVDTLREAIHVKHE